MYFIIIHYVFVSYSVFVCSKSSSVPESLKFIQRDFKKMKEERDCLDQELTSLFSLYAEKQTQLAAIIEV